MNHCPDCGYPNDWSEHRCERCGVRFHHHGPARRTAAATAENPLEFPVVPAAVPPRLDAAMTGARPGAYRPGTNQGDVRPRTGRVRTRKNLQGSLPFDAPDESPTELAEYPSGVTPGKVIRFPQPVGSTTLSPTDASETVARPEIPVPPANREANHAWMAPPRPAPVATWGPPSRRAATERPPLPPVLQGRIAFPRPYTEQPALLEFPVASLRRRALSAVVDALIVAAGCAILFVAFYYAGGRIPLGPWRSALGPLAVVLAILPLLYLHLFLTYAKQTPGMSLTGLRLVNFDGRPATARQRRLRVWASAASLASLLLGFFWAAVDDERLTWHDHMSETCLTEENQKAWERE